MRDSLIDELDAQKTEDPNYVSELTQRAKQEILRLRGIVFRYQSERQYVLGFNDGYDSAIENSQPETVVIDTHVKEPK